MNTNDLKIGMMVTWREPNAIDPKSGVVISKDDTTVALSTPNDPKPVFKRIDELNRIE